MEEEFTEEATTQRKEVNLKPDLRRRQVGKVTENHGSRPITHKQQQQKLPNMKSRKKISAEIPDLEKTDSCEESNTSKNGNQNQLIKEMELER